MPLPWIIVFLSIFLTSCGGSGVTVTKSQTVEYLSKAFTKSKKWLRSTDGGAVPEDGPPPPSRFQPSEKQAFQKSRPNNQSKGMSSDDYLRAIERLEKSIPELKTKLGHQNIEVGETYYTIGSMHQMQGNLKESKTAYKQALKIFSIWLGAEHPRVWKLKDKIRHIE